jgi:hypothetical protein
MSDDEDASKSNLVCNGQTQQWQASGVEWTKEGAKFFGFQTKMVLENVNFGNFSLEFTWLLRLRRQPSAHQYFMTNFDCVSKEFGGHLVEYPLNSGLYFGTCKQFQTTRRVYSNTPVLTSNSDEFVNVGVVGIPSSDSYSLFAGSSFITNTTREQNNCFTHRDVYACFHLGYRADKIPSVTLNGTVRAVGITNKAMTVEEINNFFEFVV